MSFESLLNTTCTIQSKTGTQSDSGQVVFSWATKASNVKTRKYRNDKPQIYDNDLKTYVDDYKFYFLVGQSIAKEDQILIDGDTYEVLSVANDSAGHHKEVIAKLTKK